VGIFVRVSCFRFGESFDAGLDFLAQAGRGGEVADPDGLIDLHQLSHGHAGDRLEMDAVTVEEEPLRFGVIE
jgi:hypothetical protein